MTSTERAMWKRRYECDEHNWKRTEEARQQAWKKWKEEHGEVKWECVCGYHYISDPPKETVSKVGAKKESDVTETDHPQIGDIEDGEIICPKNCNECGSLGICGRV